MDGSGNAYIAGYGTSSDYPTTAGAFDTSYNSGWDVFVTKLNASGTSLSYSTYLGGATYDEARGITVDGAGSAYVTGHTFSAGYPTTRGSVRHQLRQQRRRLRRVRDEARRLGRGALVLDLPGRVGRRPRRGDRRRRRRDGPTSPATPRPRTSPRRRRPTPPTTAAPSTPSSRSSRTAGGSLDFSTYLGGSSDDRGFGIAANGGDRQGLRRRANQLLGLPDDRGSVRHQLQRRLRCVRDEAAPAWLHPHQAGGPRGGPAEPSRRDRATQPDRSTCSCPPRLLGIAPGDLVAFRWDGAWEQIPVQVDEREVMDLNRPYTTTRPTCSDPCYSNPPNGGAIHPEFTDPDTFVGADSDATLDANDEVALMAFDAGGPRTTSVRARRRRPRVGGRGRDLRPARRRGRVRLPLRGHERARPRGRQGLRRLRVQPHERSLQDRRVQPDQHQRRATG